jgi:hypothetical protein
MKTRSLISATLAGALLTLGVSAQAQLAPRHDLDRDGIVNRDDSDRDGDGIRNARDPEPNRFNVARADRERDIPRARGVRGDPWGDIDRDGIPNARDSDRDGDGLPNRSDPNPNKWNPTYVVNAAPHQDIDGDGILNRNDRDRDGDGVPNARDSHPNDRRMS